MKAERGCLMSWFDVQNISRRTHPFFRRMHALVREPVFLWLTLLVNSLVLIAAAIVYIIEKDINSGIASFLDCYYWAMATTTTVGYGDVVVISDAGKFVAILLMMIGSLTHVFYTALFAQALLSPELAK